MNSDPRTTSDRDREGDEALLTAHALDQVSADERAAVEARLADPAAVEERAHVAAVRRLAEALHAGRNADMGSRSPELRRAVIAACAAASGRHTAPAITSRGGGAAWTRLALLVGGGLAAAVALVTMSSPRLLGSRRPREVAQVQQPAGGADRSVGASTAALGRPVHTADVETERVKQESVDASVKAMRRLEQPAAPPTAAHAQQAGQVLVEALAAQDTDALPAPAMAARPAAEASSIVRLRDMPQRPAEAMMNGRDEAGGADRERYGTVVETGFLSPSEHPLSTFSVDVDTASYAHVRRFLEAGRLPPRNAVRIEEMVNYFRYDMPQPEGEEPFSVTVEAADCPWRDGRQLVRVALQGRDLDRRHRPAGNIVFLVDVSGSMGEENKLPLVKQSLAMLVEKLTENDTITIVTYAGEAGLRLPPTSGDRKERILNAIASLTAGGSTHGSAGIALAYEQAAERHITGGVNRVILATDGDLNVGVTSNEALVDLVREKARAGTFLTVLGVGTGNLQDDKLEQIADHGNGIYAYIDGVREAHKVLVEQLTGSTITIAKDVKIQVEFNPARVSSYRLLGYENRALAATDFRDDRKDAGDIGAGHGVTALYEIVPVGVTGEASTEPLKYRRLPDPPSPADRPAAATHAELLTVKLRYKRPDGDTSVLREVPLGDGRRAFAAASKDLRFAAAVAAFGMILRESEHRGDATLSLVAEIAGGALGADVGGYRAEFLDLVRRAKSVREAGSAR